MHFTKMQGLGNDYLYVYGDVPENISQLSVRLSERHFGAGSDGMIYISPSEKADFSMCIFNADGSEAKMCGNGIRCVGKYVYDKGYTDKTKLTIETLSGIRTITLLLSSGKVKSVTAEMGRVVAEKEREIYIDGEPVTLMPVSVGNPHAVIFVKDAESAPVEGLGRRIEKNEYFPDGVNTEFVQVLSENRLRMRVWERGSGVTMECGTGACASAAAAVAAGRCKSGVPVQVVLDGGVLEIEVASDGNVKMTGPAEFVYEGEAML